MSYSTSFIRSIRHYGLFAFSLADGFLDVFYNTYNTNKRALEVVTSVEPSRGGTSEGEDEGGRGVANDGMLSIEHSKKSV